MQDLPNHIAIIFGITTVLTIFIFYKAAKNSKTALFILLAWIALQAAIAVSGFFTVTTTLPPRFLLLVAPPMLTIFFLFITRKGRSFLDGLDAGTLTLLHTIRIPVEIVLFLLCIYKTVPQLMTFEGRNFDILSGISAPLIFYFGYKKNKLSRTVILTWNFVCLALLLNIVINAVLSVPTTFQQFGLDQPNVAILYFPFVWLPCCVVPLVLLAHLTSIRQLLKKK